MQVWNEYATEYRAKRDELLSELTGRYRAAEENGDASNRARELFEAIAPNYKIEVLEWNHEQDHVHVLFKAQPKTGLSKFINAYKSASIRKRLRDRRGNSSV